VCSLGVGIPPADYVRLAPMSATFSRSLDDSTGTLAVTVPALGAAGVCLAFAGVQVALAGGAPLGEYVWGGTQDRVLPPGMRIVAGGAAVVLTTMASVVVSQAGLVGPAPRWTVAATWAIAGYLTLNTVGNLASTSAVERYVFGPATAVAAGLTALVAARTRRR
jgi:hypothetical protein